MAINLPDLPQAVRAYLDTKVNVTVELQPDVGQFVNPLEPCNIQVRVSNASAGNGGIALTNVRYQVWVQDLTVVKFYVPAQSYGTSIDQHGQYLVPNTLVGFFNFKPSGPYPYKNYLRIGENISARFNGRIVTRAGGFTTTVSVRILADPDINALFPRNENSTWGTTNVEVVN